MSDERRKRKKGDRALWGMFAAGFVWGAAFAFMIGVMYLRRSLIKTYPSATGFQETVRRLTGGARSMKGWKVSSAACSVPHPRDGSKIVVLKLCNGKYGAELMNDPASRKTAAMIPCSFAIYENAGGKVFASRLNMSLIGAILGGNAAKVLSAEVAPEQERMMEVLTDE